MRLALAFSLVCLMLSTGGAALAQEERPAGPPWYDMCAPMEQSSLRLIFASDQCQADFDQAFESMELPELESWMREHRDCFKEWAHFAWVAFMKNDPKMARLSWDHQLYMAKELLHEDVEPMLERGLTGEIGAEAAQHANAYLDLVEQNTSFQDVMNQAYAAARPICIYHANLIECPAAMKKALDWMYPHQYRETDPPLGTITISMVPFYRIVFTDTRTQVLASKLALRLLRRIEAGEPAVDGPTLYAMGLEEFEGDADRFWRFMVAYATRGAAWATSYKMVTDDNKPVFAAMMVVSAAMGYLDTIYNRSGTAFSYAQDAVSTCYQPKPYHYWMAAGYAYFLKRAGYSDGTSRLVARLLGAMYEISSTTYGRTPEDVFFVDTFDTKVNRARREVAHHFLGAQLGATPDAPPTQSFDATILALLDESQPLPDVSDAEMHRRLQDSATKWRLWTDLVGYYFDRRLPWQVPAAPDASL
jgi:hypothetical protein